MAVTYGFYNSSNGDRKYNALQFSRLFEGIIRDGVFSTVGGSLMVVAASNLTVNISPGRAWFNNTWTNNDALLPLTLDPAEAILNRYDAIVLEVAPDERENRFKIVKGTPATTPAKPTMIKTGGIYQYPLAYIYVGKGVGSISQANISNAVGTTECPFITGAMQQVTTNDIVAQWESEFDAWFSNVQSQLEGNVVTNLQNQIDSKLTTNGGDGKDVVVSFTEAATEAHISSGEKLSTMFGKILKKFKNVAPKSHASTGTDYGLGTTTNYGHVKTINNLTQASHVNGNALSAYQGKLLGDRVNSANIGSYLAFCTRANSDSLDAAFGKNNTDIISEIGKQIAMYAWFRGASKTTHPFNLVKTLNSFNDIVNNTAATEEMVKAPFTAELINASPFARNLIKNKVPLPPTTYDDETGSIISSVLTPGSITLPSYTEVVVSTITAPYSGMFKLYTDFVMYYDERDYIYRVTVNNVEVYKHTKTMSNYSYRHETTNISCAKNDIIKVMITNGHSSSRTAKSIGTFLVAERPFIFPSNYAVGDIPIWGNKNGGWSSRSRDGAYYKTGFIAPKTGTYRIYTAGHSYDTTGDMAIGKNEKTILAEVPGSGTYTNITLNAGDSLSCWLAGNPNVNNGYSVFSIVAVCASVNPNTFPY